MKVFKNVNTHRPGTDCSLNNCDFQFFPILLSHGWIQSVEEEIENKNESSFSRTEVYHLLCSLQNFMVYEIVT